MGLEITVEGDDYTSCRYREKQECVMRLIRMKVISSLKCGALRGPRWSEEERQYMSMMDRSKELTETMCPKL
jgi:hypothetical protein